MKSANGVAAKVSQLERKRALIRDLIERNGWASADRTAESHPSPASESRPTSDPYFLPNNVIPFPVPAK